MRKLSKRKQAEIEKVIKISVYSQAYDAMFHNEFEELANEAWVAVLSAVQRGYEPTPDLLYSIAERAIINYKIWHRCSLSVPKGTPQYAVRILGQSALSALPDEHLIFVKEPTKVDREVELKEVLGRMRADLDKLQQVVLDLFLEGYSKSDIWHLLEEAGFKDAKAVAYSVGPLQLAWNKATKAKRP